MPKATKQTPKQTKPEAKPAKPEARSPRQIDVAPKEGTPVEVKLTFRSKNERVYRVWNLLRDGKVHTKAETWKVLVPGKDIWKEKGNPDRFPYVCTGNLTEKGLITGLFTLEYPTDDSVRLVVAKGKTLPTV